MSEGNQAAPSGCTSTCADQDDVPTGPMDHAFALGGAASFEPTPNARHRIAEACVVFVAPHGTSPGTGVGTPVWGSGNTDTIAEIRSGELGPDDHLVELTNLGTENDQAAWIVFRTRPERRRGRVLVVDDDPMVREYYLDALANDGHRASAASTAAEALDLLERGAFDVVLLDIRLPDANGFELCRQVISLPGGHHGRVLLMSADPELADAAQVVAAGADGFLVNPVAPDQLHEVLDEALDRLISLGAVRSPAPGGSSAGIRLRFFGEPAISIDGGRWHPLPPGRSTDLLATLSAACPVSVTPDRLARFVWLDDSHISPNAVYTAVSRLRSFLAGIGAGHLVTSDANGYGLDIEPAQIDLVAFELATKDVFRDPDLASPQSVRAVLDRWTSQPFAGSGNTLLTRWSNRLVETRSRLLEIIALNELRAGNAVSAERACIELLGDEPWRESIWALRVVALYRCGRSNDALHAYSEALRRLRNELGLDPGPSLAGLEMLILTHDPILRDDAWLTALLQGRAARRSDPTP